MGDSFFGFNTAIEPLSNEELKRLEEETGRRDTHDLAVQDELETEVYDFEALRNELDGDQEADDGLGDQLIEEGDDLNDVTFGSSPVGKDFDFFGNTKKFDTVITEEEAFFVKHRPEPETRQPASGIARGHNHNHNLWGAAPGSHRSASPLTNQRTSVEMRGNDGGKFDASPASSIWGGFGSGLTSDRAFAAFGGSPGTLSPFGSARRTQQQHSQQQSHTPSPPPGLSPSSSFGHQQQRGQPVLLEDIEAELQRQAAAGGFHHDMPRFPGEEMEGGKTALSLADVEAAMFARGRIPQQPLPNIPFIDRSNLDHMQLQLLREHQLLSMGHNVSPDAMRAAALKKQQEMMEQLAAERTMKQQKELQRKSQYEGLMTQHDKDFINRIQLSQLASNDPFSHDFYFQVYSSLRQRAGLPSWPATNAGGSHTQEKSGRGRKEEDAVQKMHQQLQRIVNEAKRRPKQTQVSLEGALGKITSLTVRNPRQLLQVSDKKMGSASATGEGGKADSKNAMTSAKPSTHAINDRRRILKIIENVYLNVLELEQLRRQGMPKAKPGQEEEYARTMEEWRETGIRNMRKLWEGLGLADHSENSTPLLIPILSINKGRKLIPRVTRHFNGDQSLSMLTVIVAHFTQLQVCQHVIYPGSMVANVEEAKKQKFVTYEDVESFMTTVMPPLLAVIAEAPMAVVNGLLGLFMEKNDIEHVARTKPGMAFLTMLLSRAEILKQGGGALHGLTPPTPDELALWDQEYNKLFSALQGRYASIFPSLYYLVPIQPTTSIAQLALSVDDIHVWQFLAAIAVGASMEQQHVLVTEVRDRVMDNIIFAHSNRISAAEAAHRISNVNLFLHALGLDASQVMVPR